MSSSEDSPHSPHSTTSYSTAESHRALFEGIQTTITELELCLTEQHHTEMGLRVSLEAQTEQLRHLQSSFDVERNRNQRLVQLLRHVDSSSSESDSSYSLDRGQNSRSSVDGFDCVSPLLMQHRYEELSMSYQQCRKQLLKKDTKLREKQCELELLQGKYDNLLNEYKSAQKRVETLCCMYLRLRATKNAKLVKMKEALGYAVRCIMSDPIYDESEKEVLRQNLRLFMRVLKASVHEENRRVMTDVSSHID